MHSVSAAIALIAFGTILPFHIKAGLKAKKKLISGISQLIFLAILVTAAMLLYYGSEELHEGSVITHWALGLVFFVIFILHGISRSVRASALTPTLRLIGNK